MKKTLITLALCATCISLVGCGKLNLIGEVNSEDSYIESSDKKEEVDKKESKKHNPKKIRMTVEPYDITTNSNIYTIRDVKNLYKDYQKLIEKQEKLHQKYSNAASLRIDDEPFESSSTRYYKNEIRSDFNGDGKIDKNECDNKLFITEVGFSHSLDETPESLEGDAALEFHMRYNLDVNNPISIADTKFSEFIKEMMDVEVDFSEVDKELLRLRSLPEDEQPSELNGKSNMAMELSEYKTDNFRLNLYASEDCIYFYCRIQYKDNSKDY